MARWRAVSRNDSSTKRKQIAREIEATEDQLRVMEARSVVRGGRTRETMNAVTGVAQIQHTLDDETTLVDYAFTENGRYIWTIGRTAFAYRKLPRDESLEQNIERVARNLAAPADLRIEREDFLAPLRTICDSLWMPVATVATSRRIVFVADGSLAALPFAALHCSGTDSYLVESHDITVVPSASLLVEPSKQPAARVHHALVVADPIYQIDDSRLSGVSDQVATLRAQTQGSEERILERLAGGRSEALTVRRLIGEERTTVLLGADASIGNVSRAFEENYSIMHFATHGLADNRGMLGSGLVMSLFDARAQPIDGFLSARQIARWRTNADLVVLSACDSGRGRTVGGESPMGAAYGFLAAGASNVVSTLAPIGDAAAQTLIAALYERAVANNFDIPEALATTQRKAIRARPELTLDDWMKFAAFGSGRVFATPKTRIPRVTADSIFVGHPIAATSNPTSENPD